MDHRKNHRDHVLTNETELRKYAKRITEKLTPYSHRVEIEFHDMVMSIEMDHFNVPWPKLKQKILKQVNTDIKADLRFQIGYTKAILKQLEKQKEQQAKNPTPWNPFT